jgi:hypothetical protein
MTGANIEKGLDSSPQKMQESQNALVALSLRTEYLERPSLSEVIRRPGAESLFWDARKKAREVEAVLNEIKEGARQGGRDSELPTRFITYIRRRMLTDPVYVLAEQYWRERREYVEDRMPIIGTLPDDFWPPLDARDIEDLEEDPFDLKNKISLYQSESRPDKALKKEVDIVVGHDKKYLSIINGENETKAVLGNKGGRGGRLRIHEDAVAVLECLKMYQGTMLDSTKLMTLFGKQETTGRIRHFWIDRIKSARERLHQRLQVDGKPIVRLMNAAGGPHTSSVGIMDYNVTLVTFELDPGPTSSIETVYEEPQSPT